MKTTPGLASEISSKTSEETQSIKVMAYFLKSLQEDITLVNIDAPNIGGLK